MDKNDETGEDDRMDRDEDIIRKEGENRKQTSSSSQQDPAINDIPLKKAKYPWQIKGKGHLKTDTSNNEVEQYNINLPSCSTSSNNNNNNISDNNNDVPKSSSSSKKIKQHEYEKISNIKLRSAINQLVQRNWQTKQIALSVLDNTMNKMLEHFTHMQRTEDNIEDEAVAMAIQSHGLQQHNEQQQHWQNEFSLEDLQFDLTPSRLELIAPPTQDLSQTERDSIVDAAVSIAIQEKGLSVLPDTS